MYSDMSFLSRPYPRRLVVIVLALVFILGFLRTSFYRYGNAQTETPYEMGGEAKKPVEKAFVVASMQKDDVAWIHEHLPDWELNRYVVDDPASTLTVPKNKGREAMVYLTYMIDHYHTLPDLVVFMHSERYQWHNDDPIYDGVPMLKSLQIPYLMTEGYTNLRCVWTLGCPSEISQEQAAKEPDLTKTTQAAYGPAFLELFPNSTVPPIVGVACCAQFSLTRAKIQSIPLAEYQRYRQWLLDTTLEDAISGRILEYAWHIVFGKPAVHCPKAGDCYCNVFGLCSLECGDDSRCGERWAYPPYATLPQGWPETGWVGETRSQEYLDGMRNVSFKNTK